MNADWWDIWWKERGQADLALLLWALWDPIGVVPLDEYKYYCRPVVRVLKEEYERDLPLARQFEIDPEVQHLRNRGWKAAVDRLTALLAELRIENIELDQPDDQRERVAAAKLLDWYDWEMDAADPTQES